MWYKHTRRDRKMWLDRKAVDSLLFYSCLNKAIVNRHRPLSKCCPWWVNVSICRSIISLLPLVESLSMRFFVSLLLALMCKHDVILKPEVRNVSRRRRKSTEPQPQVASTKFGEEWICSSGDMLADRQTHGHTIMLIVILRSWGAE